MLRPADQNKDKSEFIRSEILREIEEGNIPRGSKLPSERKLAEMFKVSYITARKAVLMLESEGYLRKAPRKGAYVKEELEKQHVKKQIGLIIPAMNMPEISDYMFYSSIIAEKYSWNLRLFPCRSWHDSAFEDGFKFCDALLIVPPAPLSRFECSIKNYVKDSQKPVVFIGIPGKEIGFNSVMGDPAQEMTAAINFLKKAGHRKIAYMHNHNPVYLRQPKDRPYWQHLNAWSDYIKREKLDQDELSLKLDIKPFENSNQKSYETIKKYLKKNKKNLPFTGFIGLFPCFMGAYAAFIDAGISIPDSISMISMGDRSETEFIRPRITHVKISVEEHMNEAFKLINSRLHNPSADCDFIKIQPRIVEGDTVKRRG
jgi:DNA-binding LacI/PurR family transcriptional regulator